MSKVKGQLFDPSGSVAQLVEQRPFKPFVAGSIPAGPTMNQSLIKFAPVHGTATNLSKFMGAKLCATGSCRVPEPTFMS